MAMPMVRGFPGRGLHARSGSGRAGATSRQARQQIRDDPLEIVGENLLESRIAAFCCAGVCAPDKLKAVDQIRTGGRAVEGARLESVYTSKAYRGFESPSVRQEFFRASPERSENPVKTSIYGVFSFQGSPRMSTSIRLFCWYRCWYFGAIFVGIDKIPTKEAPCP